MLFEDFEGLAEECELDRELERVLELDRELDREGLEDERDEDREAEDEDRDDELDDEREDDELLLLAGALLLGAGADAFFCASRNIGLANDKVKVSASLAMRLGFVLSVMIYASVKNSSHEGWRLFFR